MPAERDFAGPVAVLACVLTVAACSTETPPVFVLGGSGDGRDRVDGGSDVSGEGGNGGGGGGGGAGGGGGGAGGSIEDDDDLFAPTATWAQGDSNLDPEKVYVSVSESISGPITSANADLLEYVYPGGDPERDTSTSRLSTDHLHHNGNSYATLPWSRPMIRRDGAIVHRNLGDSLWIANTAGDKLIAKCWLALGTWMIHPTKGSVVFQCPDEKMTTLRYYQSVGEISVTVRFHRDNQYPLVPTGYTLLAIAPDDVLLLAEDATCKGLDCAGLTVGFDDDLNTVKLPDKGFLSRLLTVRNIDDGFWVLTHSEESYTAPEADPSIKQYYPRGDMELWEITYDGDMTLIYEYESHPIIKNGCLHGHQEVVYPDNVAQGAPIFPGGPTVRRNYCQCVMATDGTAVCATSQELFVARQDGTHEMIYAVPNPGSDRIDAVLTGP